MTNETTLDSDSRHCSRHPTITLHQALKSVASHCDHARAHDTVGFSGLDASFANKMADLDRISFRQELYVARFVRKYRRQVVENYERSGVQITQGLKGKAKVAAVDAFLASLVWEHQSEEEVKAASKPKLTITAAAGERSGTLHHFVVRFPYSPVTLEAFKAAISDWRDRRFDKTDPKDPKWVVQPTPAAIKGLLALAREGFVPSDGAAAALKGVA